ncbi:igE-binding protein-like [Sorex araneus]|uniref:igE-binding protein-like n=1 Tax=Sorex araneus TaxID=42254 RepID=UPI0024334C75|nr:igE-binding protein-like [Sorex araneus]
MGTAQSVQETLNDLLRQRDIRIARQTLHSFVKEVDRVAPWYAVSGSLTLRCWNKLGKDLDAEHKKGTLRNGTKAIWKMVKNCLEDEACSLVVSETRQMRLAFPVFEGDGNGRVHAQVEFSQIKELAEAVRKYGANANYTISLLERLARDRMTPRDWQDVAKATLPSKGKFLEWKALWYDAAQDQARVNRNSQEAAHHAWTADLLTGQGVHADDQINFPWGVYTQISSLAIKAWKGLSAKGESGNQLTKIVQGPQEPFSDFVARMADAAARIFRDSDMAAPLLEQLIFEQATKECRSAIAPRKGKGLQDWLKICREIGGPLSNEGLAAAILRAQRPPASGPRKDRTCFNCGKPGHFKRDCPALRPPHGLCSRCGKGNHPAEQCRSVRNSRGQLLPPLHPTESKNGFRGPRTQGPNKYGTRFVKEGATLQPPSESLNWTSVPPPPSP